MNELLNHASELFAKPKNQNLFWYKVLKKNFERKAEAKPWLFPAIVEEGRRVTGVNDVEEICNFLDAEYEQFKHLNKTT